MIRIRTASEADIPLINELGAKAFFPTYLPFISAEQVDYMFHMMYDVPALEWQMKQRGDVFLIASAGDEPCGFAAFQLCGYDNKTAKLHKLYVLPGVQTKGIGRALLQEAERRAQAAAQDALLLNVNRYNKAIQFYERMGYVIVAEDDIDIGNGYFMNDYEMKKSLTQP